MLINTLSGSWAVLVVVVGFIWGTRVVPPIPNQFGMALWSRRRHKNDRDSESGWRGRPESR
jgi:hypothetical protein